MHLIKNQFAMEKMEHAWNLHLKSKSAILWSLQGS